jgi:CHAT domain-containing protein
LNKQEKPHLAVFYGKQAINAFQEIRGNIKSFAKEAQQSFLKDKESAYRTLADILIAQGRLPEAEQVLVMLKEEEYFEFVRGAGSEANALTTRATLTAKEATLEAEYNRLADDIARLGKQRGELYDKKARTEPDEQSLANFDKQLKVAASHFLKFLEQLEVKLGPKTAKGARVVEVQDALGMQKTLRELGQGAVLLYTLVGKDKYRIMLITPGTQQAYENPIKAVELQRKVLAFRATLQDRHSDPGPLARELYQILVGPKLAHDLEQSGAKTLMWSLDGVLRYLPVAALHDGQQYLVENYRNVVFTPASRDRLKDSVAEHWQALGLGVSQSKHVEVGGKQVALPPLSGVAKELRSIIRDASEQATNEAGVLVGRVILDENFTKEMMETALRQRYQLVHIASHFIFQPGSEINSFLLLGDKNEQHNKLTLAEIKTIRFEGVDLLTLSACETALGGEQANGVEVESFGVLAQRQGAEAVMATLWHVADESTSLLMREFYRLREANPGMTKAEALKRAQLALLTGEIKPANAAKDNRGLLAGVESAKTSFAHPYYWAPFILIGNWR